MGELFNISFYLFLAYLFSKLMVFLLNFISVKVSVFIDHPTVKNEALTQDIFSKTISQDDNCPAGLYLKLSGLGKVYKRCGYTYILQKDRYGHKE